jgi:hypothetical protein
MEANMHPYGPILGLLIKLRAGVVVLMGVHNTIRIYIYTYLHICLFFKNEIAKTHETTRARRVESLFHAVYVQIILSVSSTLLS